MSDCSQHKKDILGETDMKVLAEMIGDLHYESLAELFKHLSNKILKDGTNDLRKNKDRLASELYSVSGNLSEAYKGIKKAWQISKPFMTDSTTIK